MIHPPQPPRLADAALARYLRDLDAWVRSLTPRPSPDILPSQSPNGTSYRLARRPVMRMGRVEAVVVSGSEASLYGPPAMDAVHWSVVYLDSWGAVDPDDNRRIRFAPGLYLLGWIVCWVSQADGEQVSTHPFHEGGGYTGPVVFQTSQAHATAQPDSHSATMIYRVNGPAALYLCVPPGTQLTAGHFFAYRLTP